MKKIIIIFLTGILILSGAIIINLVANIIGLTTWYEFISESNITKKPLQTEIASLIFLFIIYPFTLGLIAYFFLKKINEKIIISKNLNNKQNKSNKKHSIKITPKKITIFSQI